MNALIIAAIICGVCALALGTMVFFAKRAIKEGFQHPDYGFLEGKPSDYGIDPREVDQ